MSHTSYIHKAINESFKSNCTHKHGAIIVDTHTGKIVSKGYNRLTNSQKHLLSVHAEMDALRKIKSFYNKYSNLVMYIIRFDKYGLKYSKPCLYCATNIKKFGIRKVFFSYNHEYVDKVIGSNDIHIKINNPTQLTKFFKKTPTINDCSY